MTLRARLAILLGLLTATAVTAMAFVGYRSTSTRLYEEIDRSLSSSASRFADPDARYASSVCAQLARAAPADAGGDQLANLPGTSVQCINHDGEAFAVSSSESPPVGPRDVELAERGGPVFLRTVDDDRVMTVPVSGGGAVQLSRELSEVQHVLQTLRVRFASIGALITALAALIGWLIARQVTRPVTRLTAATATIAESGRLDIDIPPGGPDETGRLAHSFAMMLDALRRSREQQQRLAQDAGHELRTPLTSLRTNVDVLRRHPELEPPTRERILSDVDTELRELSDLTNELVALATEEADDEPEQSVDLAALARRAAARAERRRHHRVVVDSEPSVPLVRGRPRQLLRVLDNLLGNAAKFDRSAEPIIVTVGVGRISVRDHGPGIAAEDLEHVFDRFYHCRRRGRNPARASACRSPMNSSSPTEVRSWPRPTRTAERSSPSCCRPPARPRPRTHRARSWTSRTRHRAGRTADPTARTRDRKSRRPVRLVLTNRLPETRPLPDFGEGDCGCAVALRSPRTSRRRPPRRGTGAARPPDRVDRGRERRRRRVVRGPGRELVGGEVNGRPTGHERDRATNVASRGPRHGPADRSNDDADRAGRQRRQPAEHADFQQPDHAAASARPATVRCAVHRQASPERGGDLRRIVTATPSSGGRSSFPALGTTAVVVVTDAEAIDGAVHAVERAIGAVDAACSRFRV